MPALELDEKLILEMAEGNKEAFKELYQKTDSVVFGYALSILKNRHDAEDVMHDTYLRIWSGAGSYEPKGRPIPWMLTIVRNLCLNRIRDKHVHEDLSLYTETVHSGPDEKEGVLNKAILEMAFKILDPDERQIVMLHALTGKKHREIAETLALPTGTVLSKYNRALKKMKKQISGKGADR